LEIAMTIAPSFIHAPGCTCSAESPSYAAQPSAHYDSHMLDLYRAVFETRAAVASFDAAHPNGWDFADCNAPSPNEWEAFRAATLAAETAQASLVDALATAMHGAQPDGSFVTRQSTHVASGHYIHTLHAPGKGGPLVEAQDGERFGGPTYLRALRTREEARAIRETERTRNREAQALYAVRRRAARVALMHGKALPYSPGQEFGSVRIPSGDHVSARGALRAAGLTREAAEKLLSESWERLGLSYDSYRDDLRLTLRGVEVST
jgi:hypothetical protein